jgi:hypothetical protein
MAAAATAIALKETEARVQVGKVQRKVYVNKYGTKFIKQGGTFVLLSKVEASKKKKPAAASKKKAAASMKGGRYGMLGVSDRGDAEEIMAGGFSSLSLMDDTREDS